MGVILGGRGTLPTTPFRVPADSFSCCQPKKKAQCESCELSFIWGKNEDCSSGDSTSDTSEKLLHRGKGKGQYICDFSNGGSTCNQAHVFQKVSTSLMKLLLVTRTVITMKDFGAFLDMI